MRDFVELNDLYPLIKEVLDNGGTFRFYPRGTSMEPLLHAGSDSIVLDSVKDIAAGDVLFYKRKNGQFVLHRVVKVAKDGSYTMCGDNQYAREQGIKHSQIIGIVTEFNRNGKDISCKNPLYVFYCFIHVKKQYIYGIYARARKKIVRIIKKLIIDKEKNKEK